LAASLLLLRTARARRRGRRGLRWRGQVVRGFSATKPERPPKPCSGPGSRVDPADRGGQPVRRPTVGGSHGGANVVHVCHAGGRQPDQSGENHAASRSRAIAPEKRRPRRCSRLDDPALIFDTHPPPPRGPPVLPRLRAPAVAWGAPATGGRRDPLDHGGGGSVLAVEFRGRLLRRECGALRIPGPERAINPAHCGPPLSTPVWSAGGLWPCSRPFGQHRATNRPPTMRNRAPSSGTR